MKSLSILFSILFLVTFNSSLAQKVKREVVTIKYLKATRLPLPSSRYYNVDIEEKREELDGSISENKLSLSSSSADPRHKFYYSNFNFLNTFKFTSIRQEPGSVDTISLLNLIAGQTEIIASTAASENIVNEAKQVTGVRWFMRVTINLPFASKFSNEKSEVLIDQNEKAENITYSYPTNFSKTNTITFSSKDALEKSYNANKSAFLLEIRDHFISVQIAAVKSNLDHTFNDRDEFFAVDFYSVKGKKGEFDDLDLLLSETTTILEEVKANFKAKNNLNWHTEAMNIKFTELAEKFGKLLADDQEKSKNGQPTRFTSDGQDGLFKNVLWCKFFSGEFDFVIKEATRAHEAQAGGTELLPEKVFFDNIIPIAKMYQPIYLNNKARFNWF